MPLYKKKTLEVIYLPGPVLALRSYGHQDLHFNPKVGCFEPLL